ncbi:N-acetyltransferase [Jatrophihabitans sp. YIM 134969]
MPARSEVRLATAADRDVVVATVVAAFDRDPAFRYFFSDDFVAQATLFAGGLFDRRVGRGAVWVAADGDAVAMWEPPRDAAEPPGDPDDDDLDVLDPAARVRLDAWDRAVHHLMPTGTHWYLGILATHPRRAGEGWGRVVVGPGLAAARADGLPAYLETATAANVAMYTRRGWTVVDAVAIAGITATVMRHDGAG